MEELGFILQHFPLHMSVFYEKAFVIDNKSYCRYDWLAKKTLVSGYFLWAMLAYGFGENQLIDSRIMLFFLQTIS